PHPRGGAKLERWREIGRDGDLDRRDPALHRLELDAGGLAGLPPALRRTGAQRFIDQRLVLALGVDELAEARLAARDVEQEHGRMRELLRRAEARERGGRVAAFIELEPLVAELQRAGGGLRRGVRRASHGRQRQRGARHAATRAGERQGGGSFAGDEESGRPNTGSSLGGGLGGTCGGLVSALGGEGGGARAPEWTVAGCGERAGAGLP